MSHESPEFIAEMIQMCRSEFGDSEFTALQVGAFDAYEFGRLADALHNCRAVAVEASPDTAAQFAGHEPRVEYHCAMLAECTELREFYIHKDSPVLSSLLPRERAEPVSLWADTMDDWCARHGICPEFIMIDTEGTTLEVLLGGMAIINACRLICAEAQTGLIEDLKGHALKPQIDGLLDDLGFDALPCPPGYSAGMQGNYWWRRRRR